jgi:hypothetical protein
MKKITSESEFEVGKYYFEYSRTLEMIGVSLFTFHRTPTVIDDGIIVIIWRYGLVIGDYFNTLKYDEQFEREELVSRFTTRSFFDNNLNEYWVLDNDEELTAISNIL